MVPGAWRRPAVAHRTLWLRGRTRHAAFVARARLEGARRLRGQKPRQSQQAPRAGLAESALPALRAATRTVWGVDAMNAKVKASPPQDARSVIRLARFGSLPECTTPAND